MKHLVVMTVEVEIEDQADLLLSFADHIVEVGVDVESAEEEPGVLARTSDALQALVDIKAAFTFAAGITIRGTNVLVLDEASADSADQ